MLLRLIFLFSLSSLSYGDVVSPSKIDLDTYRITGDHIFHTPTLGGEEKLLITIGGTGSNPIEFKNVHTWGKNLGFHVLGVDYPNGLISTVCQTSTELDCYDNYRKEIVEGIDVSPILNVNRKNSIIYRIKSLIRYLAKTYPANSWDSFLDQNGNPRFEKIMIAGHSQGAGHVGYLGKLFKFNKIIIVGGPHDQHGEVPAKWLSHKGQTNPEDIYALLHWKDYFGYKLQIKTSRILMGNSSLPLVMFDTKLPEVIKGRIFISNHPVRDPHNSLALEIYQEVWEYLLR